MNNIPSNLCIIKSCCKKKIKKDYYSDTKTEAINPKFIFKIKRKIERVKYNLLLDEKLNLQVCEEEIIRITTEKMLKEAFKKGYELYNEETSTC